MNKILWGGFFLIFLTGCAGPKYMGSAIDDVDIAEVVIVNNKETKPGFQETMEVWLNKNNYTYVIVPDGSNFVPEKINLEYSGIWRWDLAIFLNDAYIKAYHGGQRIGEVEYKAPNNLNTNKFSSAEKRIGYMMDALFGKITVDEANQLITVDAQR